jgi:DNA-binding transcriptional MerR regulator
LRSSQVAAAAGVNRQTLRYYERRGLLAEPDRSLGGHRLYPPEAVTVLLVIKAQRLGFTLDEVASVRRGRHRHATSDIGLRSRARAKLTEVEAKINDPRSPPTPCAPRWTPVAMIRPRRQPVLSDSVRLGGEVTAVSMLVDRACGLLPAD